MMESQEVSGWRQMQCEERCSSSEYTYRAMNKDGAIRLIDLQPDPNVSGQVRCNIIYTTLQDCESNTLNHYAALSYVWGNESVPVTIKVDGFDFKITQNLDSALRHIRDPLVSRYIWADAICINQSDEDEKAVQVLQMWKVYRTACRTVIYLGDATESSDKALTFLKKSKSEPYRWDFEDILQRPWFQRVWVLQEFVFSQDPWIQCGKESTSWSDFSNKLLSKSWFTPINVAAFNNVDRARERRLEREGLGSASRSNFHKELFLLLSSRRGLGVKDARDMIFAHVGIAGLHDLPRIINTKAALLLPDYSKPTKALFEDCAANLLADSADYYILSRAESTVDLDSKERGVLNLASWAPDWTEAKMLRPIRTLRSCLELVKLNDRSSRSLPSSCEPYRLSASVIAFPGHRVEILQHISPLISNMRGDLSATRNTNLGSNVDKNGKRTLYDLCNEMLAPFQIPPERTIHNFWEGTTTYDQTEDGIKQGEPLWLVISWTQNQDKFSQVVDRLTPLAGRRLATTQDGRLAIVPARARPGDHICQLGYDKIQFVLRPYQTTPENDTSKHIEKIRDALFKESEWPDLSSPCDYQFVGECFLDGEWEKKRIYEKYEQQARSQYLRQLFALH